MFHQTAARRNAMTQSLPTSSRSVVNVEDVDLVETWYDDDPDVRVSFGSVFDATSGAAATSVLFLEVPEGHRTPWHTHSAEEIVLVLEGTAEAGIGDERVRLGARDIALVPAHVPHGLDNVGDGPLRFVGFFASAGMVHVFDRALQPFGEHFLATPPAELLPVPARA
jgi:quercetin dioxygenase-like cupin family protein